MRNRQIAAAIVLVFALLFPVLSSAQSLSFKEIQARVSEYKVWLDKLGSNGLHYWLRLDGTQKTSSALRGRRVHAGYHG